MDWTTLSMNCGLDFEGSIWKYLLHIYRRKIRQISGPMKSAPVRLVASFFPMKNLIRSALRFLPLSWWALLAFCFTLSLSRMLVSGHLRYIFLNWNLFLALVPLVFSYRFLSSIRQKEEVPSFFWFLSWLAFFPNAPYLITDLIHLQRPSPIPLWFDALLLFSYATAGMMLGLRSLKQVYLGLSFRFSEKIRLGITSLILFATAFGVYLGRFQRWNSWDFLVQPQSLLLDIGHRFLHPELHLRTWAVTLLFGIFLHLLFACFQKEKSKPEKVEI